MTISSAETGSFESRIRTWGCSGAIRLDVERGAEQVGYLDLVKQGPLTAVVEHAGSPLLYLVDALRPLAVPDRDDLRRRLANRSDPAWLGVVQAGTLEVFPIGFKPHPRPAVALGATNPRAPLLFQGLVQGAWAPEITTDTVYHRVFELLDETLKSLAPPGTDPARSLALLSMAGRTLFFRFLIDRQIVQPADLASICPVADDLQGAFSGARAAALTSAWLDLTFNGDFLPLVEEPGPEVERTPLYEAFFRSQPPEVFTHLEAILRGWKAVDNARFQVQFDWNDLLFAHVPAGVLSQVWEQFSHRIDPLTASETSVHYTPRTIVSLMVDEVFAAQAVPDRAHVLDPACGAGTFLSVVFRRLVKERWVRQGRRPSAPEIREILYRQVRGFDVSESALRLAALVLYITAIELDGSPRPPEGLRFPRALRGEVLHHLDHPMSRRGFVLGSLGTEVPTAFDHAFDIVLGNPPWTRLRANGEEEKQEIVRANKAFTEIGRQALWERDLHKAAENYRNPDFDPDLPFLWRSLRWAREGGSIALALPARVFTRTEGPGAAAWQAVLAAVSVTGLINGADLRKSAVWDGIDVPFSILFARNALPLNDHHTWFTAPRMDRRLNGIGRFRIDYGSTVPLPLETLRQEPWVLKALSVGTVRDTEVLRVVKGRGWSTLGELWVREDPRGLRTGQGYNRSPNLKQKAAPWLGDLLDFEKDDAFDIRYDRLRSFYDNHRCYTAFRPRIERLYQPPLVLISQSPGDDQREPKAWISRVPIAFSQSFYGYSCSDLPNAAAFASLLYLLPHSTFTRWYLLLTSTRVGSDRQTFNKREFDALPFMDPADLTECDRTRAIDLARRLREDQDKPWDEIDAFIFGLYGLGSDDVQVARDTLFTFACYREQGRDAFEATRPQDRHAFRTEVASMLDPFFEVCNRRAFVVEPTLPLDDRDAWRFLAMGAQGHEFQVDSCLLQAAMGEADRTAASRVLIRVPGYRGLLLGILNERRWWTLTRARLCARDILRDFLDAFDLDPTK